MNLRSIAIGLAFVAGSGTWAAAHATADGPDHYRVRGVAPGGALSLRAEPSLGAPRVGRIPAGAQCLRSLGCRGGLSLEEFATLTPVEQKRRSAANPRWCKVDFQGTVGWVAGRYLAEVACPPSGTAAPVR